MKKVLIMLGVLSVIALSVGAPIASAFDKQAAEATAQVSAQRKWNPTAYVSGCNQSGKHGQGEPEWYCWGHFGSESGEWKINLDPSLSITYERR